MLKKYFLDANYVSITKFEVTEWEEVVMEVREFIRAFIEEGNVILNRSSCCSWTLDKNDQPELNLNATRATNCLHFRRVHQASRCL